MATTACSVGTSPQALGLPGLSRRPAGSSPPPQQKEKVEQFGWSRVPQDRSFGARFGGLASDSDAFPPNFARPGPETTPQAPSAPQGGAPTSSSLMASMGSAIIVALNTGPALNRPKRLRSRRRTRRPAGPESPI